MNPLIILVEPQLDQNIGKVARAMLNFNLRQLRLVSPKADWLSKSARALSAGADEVLEQAQIFDTFDAAIQDLHLVYATTTRPRDLIKDVVTAKIAAVDARHAAASGHTFGFVFGPERTGLENHHIARCSKVLTIPLNPDFSSLNLAQAVVLVAYEWFQSEGGQGCDQPAVLPQAQAACKDIEDLVAHLDRELDQGGYYRTDNKRPLMQQNLYNMFARIPLTVQEVRTLRGVISTLVNPHGIYSRRGKRDHVPQLSEEEK